MLGLLHNPACRLVSLVGVGGVGKTRLAHAQVAEQLIISRRTVSTHLSAIYGQLQVGSRSGATRFAVEHGLV